jgi:hypothetical protein
MITSFRLIQESAKSSILCHLGMRCALLLPILAEPALGYAQFQQPTPEELKMTADPGSGRSDSQHH